MNYTPSNILHIIKLAKPVVNLLFRKNKLHLACKRSSPTVEIL